MKKTYRIIKLGLEGNIKYLIFYIFVVVSIMCVSLGSTFVQKDIVNIAEENCRDGHLSSRFVLECLLFTLMLFFTNASRFLHTYVHNSLSQNVEIRLNKCLMYRSYMTMHDEFYRTEFLKKYSYICKNMNRISRYILNVINTLFNHVLTLIIIIYTFARYTLSFSLFFLFTLVIYSITAIFTSKKRYQMSKEQIGYQREADYYSEVLMKKEYSKELRLYKSKNFFLGIWNKVYKRLFVERYKLTNKNSALGMLTEIVSFGCQAFVMYLLIRKCCLGEIGLGDFVLLIGLIEKSKSSIKFVVENIIAGTYEVAMYMNDYVDYVLPITEKEKQDIKNGIPELTSKNDEFKKLTVENVSYKYPNGEKNAVNRATIEVNQGEVVCILGYNGSGKSTLIKLLTGILSPQEGVVKINGKQLSAENKIPFSEYFGMAFQDFPRYSLSVKETVGIGKVEKMKDENALRKAYEKTGLMHLFENYQKKDEVILGKEYADDGIDLSGGEWQQVILTQAHMGEPPVLIFDEPTASLDPIAEMKILGNFREMVENRTAILISHRIGFARIADRIIVMDNGEIKEQGSHDELMQKMGLYYKMFSTLQELYI